MEYDENAQAMVNGGRDAKASGGAPTSRLYLAARYMVDAWEDMAASDLLPGAINVLRHAIREHEAELAAARAAAPAKPEGT